MIENVIIKSSSWRDKDVPLLFGGEPVHFSDAQSLPELLVEVGAFPSKGQARKAGRSGEIPSGFTFEFKANKKMRPWIWNPIDDRHEAILNERDKAVQEGKDTVEDWESAKERIRELTELKNSGESTNKNGDG